MNVLAVLPFLILLLSIAVLPGSAPRFWESNRNKAFVSLLLAIPALVVTLHNVPNPLHALKEVSLEYVSFIILLAVLYLISGGVYFKGSFSGKPLANLSMLFLGAVLSSVMGTTGASMVLIRPFLESLSHRKNRAHIVVFFIIVVGNAGGSLTPLGDPPLFLGYLYGVPFAWTFTLAHEWVFAILSLCLMFFLLDLYLYRSENGDARMIKEEFELHGAPNLLLLIATTLSVALIRDSLTRNVVLLLLAGASLVVTKPAVREKNRFSLHPIKEVAVLFLGIFMTMVPVIHILKSSGPSLPLHSPRQFFLICGLLSSFLDNTPTYAIFFKLAQTKSVVHEIAGVQENLLRAVSLSAVLFGALTYIGNAPNLMIRAIAEHQDVKMPSFISYFLYAFLALTPVLLVISFLWL